MSARVWQRRRAAKRLRQHFQHAPGAVRWLREWINSPHPVDGIDVRHASRIANIDAAPLAPTWTIDSFVETWNAIQAASEHPMIRYMSTAEYAAECVCLFLRWGVDEHADFGDDVVWATPRGEVLDDVVAVGTRIEMVDTDP